MPGIAIRGRPDWLEQCEARYSDGIGPFSTVSTQSGHSKAEILMSISADRSRSGQWGEARERGMQLLSKSHVALTYIGGSVHVKVPLKSLSSANCVSSKVRKSDPSHGED